MLLSLAFMDGGMKLLAPEMLCVGLATYSCFVFEAFEVDRSSV
jgi:hypothetical protein